LWTPFREMRHLPPIDAHAHVVTNIDKRDLRALRAVVFAVTREPREWEAALTRRDDACVWGLGCHPGLSSAAADFDSERLFGLLAGTPLIGEVGLDARSKIPGRRQRDVLEAVLEVAQVLPRILSVHSVGRTDEVLRSVRQRPSSGVVLHWWRGTEEETRAAVELGCYFSVNGAETKGPKVLAHVPRDRVLTETDFPYSRRSDRAAARPGAVSTIEEALARTWKSDVAEVRRQVWTNLGRLCASTNTLDLMPRSIQATLLTVTV
jgi:TatD DNase family protein